MYHITNNNSLCVSLSLSLSVCLSLYIYAHTPTPTHRHRQTDRHIHTHTRARVLARAHRNTPMRTPVSPRWPTQIRVTISKWLILWTPTATNRVSLRTPPPLPLTPSPKKPQLYYAQDPNTKRFKRTLIYLNTHTIQQSSKHRTTCKNSTKTR